MCLFVYRALRLLPKQLALKHVLQGCKLLVRWSLSIHRREVRSIRNLESPSFTYLSVQKRFFPPWKIRSFLTRMSTYVGNILEDASNMLKVLAQEGPLHRLKKNWGKDAWRTSIQGIGESFFDTDFKKCPMWLVRVRNGKAWTWLSKLINLWNNFHFEQKTGCRCHDERYMGIRHFRSQKT